MRHSLWRAQYFSLESSDLAEGDRGMPTSQLRVERVNLRLSKGENLLLQRAAKVADKPKSTFAREQTLAAVRSILAREKANTLK